MKIANKIHYLIISQNSKISQNKNNNMNNLNNKKKNKMKKTIIEIDKRKIFFFLNKKRN